MKTNISIRQIIFLFIFTSITPIFSYIPNVCASHSQNAGYISAVYGGILLSVYAFFLLQIIRAYPYQNFYDILKNTFGLILAKIIILLYGMWALLFLTFKINSYTTLLQTTLLPSINVGILIIFLFLLVLYAVKKGAKTIFRFSEFFYGISLFFLAALFLFSFRSMNKEYLVPVTIEHFKSSLLSIPDICAIGGNLVLLLFFAECLITMDTHDQIRKRIYSGILIFTVFCTASVFMVIAICGSQLTAEFNYPVFQAVKSVTLLSSFERFDSFITLICVLSDFTTISIFLIVVIQCIGNLFPTKIQFSIGIALFITGCTFVMINKATQIELNSFYLTTIIYINLIFQYALPILIGIIALLKNKKYGNKT